MVHLQNARQASRSHNLGQCRKYSKPGILTRAKVMALATCTQLLKPALNIIIATHPRSNWVCCAVQSMLVHPGWHAIIPCSKSLTEIYLAMEFGNMDLQVDVSKAGRTEKQQLRDLTTIPAYQQAPLCAELSQHIVANMKSVSAPGDAFYQAALKSLGAFTSLPPPPPPPPPLFQHRNTPAPLVHERRSTISMLISIAAPPGGMKWLP